MRHKSLSDLLGPGAEKYGISVVKKGDLPDNETALFDEAANLWKWPDFQFKTPDGREFRFFSNGIGSLRHKLQALGVWLSKRDKERINKLAGLIMDSDSMAPFIFANTDDLARAWLELRRISGLPLVDDEMYEPDAEEWEFFRECHNEVFLEFYPLEDDGESEDEA